MNNELVKIAAYLITQVLLLMISIVTIYIFPDWLNSLLHKFLGESCSNATPVWFLVYCGTVFQIIHCFIGLFFLLIGVYREQQDGYQRDFDC